MCNVYAQVRQGELGLSIVFLNQLVNELTRVSKQGSGLSTGFSGPLDSAVRSCAIHVLSCDGPPAPSRTAATIRHLNGMLLGVVQCACFYYGISHTSVYVSVT